MWWNKNNETADAAEIPACIILAEFTFSEKNAKEAIRLLDELEGFALDEEGCELFEVTYSVTEPTRVFVYQSYESDEAYNAHRSSAYFKEIMVGKVIPLTETSKVTRLNEAYLSLDE